MKDRLKSIFSMIVMLFIIFIFIFSIQWIGGKQSNCTQSTEQSEIMGRFNSLEIKMNDGYNETMNRFDELKQGNDYISDLLNNK